MKKNMMICVSIFVLLNCVQSDCMNGQIAWQVRQENNFISWCDGYLKERQVNRDKLVSDIEQKMQAGKEITEFTEKEIFYYRLQQMRERSNQLEQEGTQSQDQG